MILKNALYLDENFCEKTGAIEIEDGRILRVAEDISYKDEDFVIDCAGFRIIPGLIDIHTHGCVGFDASDGDKDGILEMSRFLISQGVTSFCPTTMTLPVPEIKTALAAIYAAREAQENGASIVGIHLEGPFLSVAKKGAQRGDCIVPPTLALFQELQEAAGGLIKLVSLAPEAPNALEFIKEIAPLCTVSIAHTTADYSLAKESFAAGITHATHLYNAMSGFSHREPGVVGAVLDTDAVRGELICDGHHIHPAVVRTSFRLLENRVIVVSDSMRLCGLGEGEKGELGGQEVTLEGGKVTLADGTIAGSVTNLHQELKNLVAWGIPFSQAVRAMTLTPACAIGLSHEIGSIAPGKKADLLVLDENLDIAAVYH